MSKNIDEIVLETLPRLLDSVLEEGNSYARYRLKQALTEKKLCVPLTKTKIKKLLVDNSTYKNFTSVSQEIVADANLLVDVLFEAQFKESK